MCQNSENDAKLPISTKCAVEKGQRIQRNVTLATRPLAKRPKSEFYESNVYELIVNCATGIFLRAPQAR